MKKELGQIFTPDSIASFILDEIGYNEDCILTKKIIEPSFGDGAFLQIIIERLINVALKKHYKKSQIAALIRDNIYGFEIDTNFYSIAIKNLKLLLEKYSIPYSLNTFINLKNTNALVEYKKYLNFFDFVVGNPPYVRIKNLPHNEKMLLKTFNFTTGTTDLYIAFFELAFYMLSNDGKIGYITPNSFLYNSSQSSFRAFLFNYKFIEKIYNFENLHVFPDASVRTCISILNNKKNNTFYYKSYINKDTAVDFNITPEQINPYAPYYLPDNLNSFIIKNQSKKHKLGDFVEVQNGIATNADSVFIFNKNEIPDIEPALIRKCIKASRCDSSYGEKYILFPYKNNDKGFIGITENELQKYPLTYNYLLLKKSLLEKRDIDMNTSWFLFARQQGLKKSHQPKLAIKHIFAENDLNIKTLMLDEDTIVYSKYYIIAKQDNNKEYILSQIQKILSSEDFLFYAKTLARKKYGGYLEISADIIKNFGIDFSIL